MSDEERWADKLRAQAMLDAETTLTDLPDGGYRVEKAGVVGVGRTVKDAVRDFAEKFAVAFMQHPLPGDDRQ